MITIDEIDKTVGLSARALNICNLNGLDDLDSLMNYYNKKGDFLDLTNCGIKSNLELKILCERLKIHIGSDGKESLRCKTNPNLQKAYNLLSKEEKRKLSQKLHYEIKKLSLRSRNSLFRFFDGEVNLDKLYEVVLSDPTFDPLSIEGVGRRSEKEIQNFFNQASDFILQSVNSQ